MAFIVLPVPLLMMMALIAAFTISTGRAQICPDPRPLPSFDDTFEYLNTDLWAVTEGVNHCSVLASCTYASIDNAVFNTTLDPMASLSPSPSRKAGSGRQLRGAPSIIMQPLAATAAHTLVHEHQQQPYRSLLSGRGTSSSKPSQKPCDDTSSEQPRMVPLASSVLAGRTPPRSRLASLLSVTSSPAYGPGGPSAPAYGPSGPSTPSPSYPPSPGPRPSPLPSTNWGTPGMGQTPTPTPLTKPRGLLMTLSQKRCQDSSSACCAMSRGKNRCARWSGYHMVTPRCMLYGTLEITMAISMPRGSYSVFYIGLYSGVGPNSVNPWQEIDMGWTGFNVVNGDVVFNGTLITDTYMNGPLLDGPKVNLGFWSDMLQFKTYRLDWAPELLTWSVDGVIVHSLTGREKVPDLPQSLRVILRTANGRGDGPPSQVWMQRMRYTALPSSIMM